MHRLWGIWSKVSQNLKYPTRSGACQCSGTTKTLDGKTTLQIYTVKLQWKRDTCKKCTLYKYLPYTVQCRSYSKKTVNQLYIYSTVLGAAIKCKQYSEITVESGTHVKSVKITLNIFSVWSKSIKEDFQNAHWIKILNYLCMCLGLKVGRYNQY